MESISPEVQSSGNTIKYFEHHLKKNELRVGGLFTWMRVFSSHQPEN
jgi:hypothetical protein